jgi:hypothetical protein
VSTGEESGYRERLRRLSAILTDIAERAQAQSAARCPYRDARDRCTGRFRCRNQRAGGHSAQGCPPDLEAGPGVLACTHDERFDYREAWEDRPRGGG